MQMSLKARLILLITVLLTFSVLASLLATNWLLQKTQRKSILANLSRTELAVNMFLRAERGKLLSQSRLVGELPILASVVENGDPTTILDVAKTYANQSQLAIFDVVDVDGDVIASVEGRSSDDAVGEQAASIIGATLEGGRVEATLAVREHQLAILASAPIGLSDDPSGALIVGSYLNNDFAAQIRDLTKADVSFQISEDAISASSLSADDAAVLLRHLHSNRIEATGANGAQNLDIGTHLIKIVPLSDANRAVIGAMLVQYSLTESEAVLSEIRVLLLAVGGAIVLFALSTGLLFVFRSIINPINNLKAGADQLAQGNLSYQIEVRRHDEIGELAGAINKFGLKLGEIINEIRHCSGELSNSADELTKIAHFNASGAEETSSQALIVAKAAEQVNANVASVASAVEQMSASIKEVAQTVIDSSHVTSQAVGISKEASAIITRLGEDSREIDQVTKAITNIANQINILALNATIEAARAGEAGKGFAVVAREVKDLANETAKATGDITERIEVIQSHAASAVAAVDEITRMTGEVAGQSANVASVIEEQSAATNQILSIVSETANRMNEIVGSTAGIAKATQGAAENSTQTMNRAQDLNEVAGRLSGIVQSIKNGDSRSNG